jgi:hypothetical protein
MKSIDVDYIHPSVGSVQCRALRVLRRSVFLKKLCEYYIPKIDVSPWNYWPLNSFPRLSCE